MEENELSVQELSNKTGKSIQSIYKRIKNENDVIQGFLKRDNEGNILEPVRIFESVIDVIYNKGATATKLNTKPSLVEFRQKEEKEESKQEQNAYTKAIEVLQDQINLLKEELEVEREEKKQKDIIEQLDKVEQPYRAVLEKYYIQGKKLVTVASEMNYNYEYTKKINQIALKKFEKIKDFPQKLLKVTM